MSLPWVRLDSNIATHDKINAVLAETSGAQAFVLYVCSIAWSGGQGTDGHIPKHMLRMLHGTPKLAQMLVQHRLWDDAEGGWEVHNYAWRQELKEITDAKRETKAINGKKAACQRWHEDDCECWRNAS